MKKDTAHICDIYGLNDPAEVMLVSGRPLSDVLAFALAATEPAKNNNKADTRYSFVNDEKESDGEEVPTRPEGFKLIKNVAIKY